MALLGPHLQPGTAAALAAACTENTLGGTPSTPDQRSKPGGHAAVCSRAGSGKERAKLRIQGSSNTGPGWQQPRTKRATGKPHVAAALAALGAEQQAALVAAMRY